MDNQKKMTKEMSEFLPIILQVFNNPSYTQNLTESGKKWNGLAIFQEFAKAAGWEIKQDLIQ